MKILKVVLIYISFMNMVVWQGVGHLQILLVVQKLNMFYQTRRLTKKTSNLHDPDII